MGPWSGGWTATRARDENGQATALTHDAGEVHSRRESETNKRGNT